ncbi:MAG: HD domain-containing protein [Eubacteriales bacterium]|nr:HD domain-containing protein [Eubacteriales bacterium]
MKVKELENNGRGEFRLLLNTISEKETTTGKAFCDLGLKPAGEPEFLAKIWDQTAAQLSAVTAPGTAVMVTLKRNDYRGNKSYIVEHMTADKNPTDIQEFVDGADIEPQKMVSFARHLMEAAPNDAPERIIFEDIYDAYKDKICAWAAAESLHHAYTGGLAYHSVMVMTDCRVFSRFLGRVNAIREMSNERLLLNIKEILDQGDASCEAAKNCMEELLVNEESGEYNLFLQRKLAAMSLGVMLQSNYHSIDKDVFLAAEALRGISMLSISHLDNVIGMGPADWYLAAPYFDETEISEIEHCLLTGVALKPATAEAFYLQQMEELAAIAMESEADQFQTTALMAAAALHDIGKLTELETNPVGSAHYTVPGSLYGHIPLGIELVLKTAGYREISPERISVLLNCIASHHGREVWGSTALPNGNEARVLFAMDYLDSRMDMFSRRVRSMEIGETDPSLRKYIGNVIYRAK